VVTEDEVLDMDESIFGDLDEMALPELPDSVWMRLLANALDPDAPPVGLDLIPVDLPTDQAPADDDAAAMLGASDTDDTDGGDGDVGTPDDEDGTDVVGLHDAPHDDIHSGDHDSYGHGGHDSVWASEGTEEDHPWQDGHDGV
jgi:hypothetical protein